jgi:hypothetical protein
MVRIFDYKFVIILGISIIVYFLYREVEQLQKRVCSIENSLNSTESSEISLLDLPPPPEAIELSEKHTTVEEYSNDSESTVNIYSHDVLNTNTNENDSVGVVSIINMVADTGVETPKEPVENNLENLLKKKLSELQDMATNLGISTIVDNSKKRKTKAELANDILSKK